MGRKGGLCFPRSCPRIVGDLPSEKRARQGLKISFPRSPVSRFLIKMEYRNRSPSANFGQDDFKLRERRKVPFPSLSTDPRWPAAVVLGAVVRLGVKGTVRQCPSLLLERSDSTRSGRQLFFRPFLRAAALRSSSPSPSLPHAVTMPDLKLDFSPSFPPSFPSTKMRNSSAAWKGKKGSQVQVFPNGQRRSFGPFVGGGRGSLVGGGGRRRRKPSSSSSNMRAHLPSFSSPHDDALRRPRRWKGGEAAIGGAKRPWLLLDASVANTTHTHTHMSYCAEEEQRQRRLDQKKEEEAFCVLFIFKQRSRAPSSSSFFPLLVFRGNSLHHLSSSPPLSSVVAAPSSSSPSPEQGI